MKRICCTKRLFSVVLLLASLCSCAFTPEVSVTPVVSETPANTPEVSQTPPQNQVAPSIPESDRKYTHTPYLVKLEPYSGSSYTDGANTFVFKDDGSVLCNDSYSGVFLLESKNVNSDNIDISIYDSDDFKLAIKKAEEKLSEISSFDTIYTDTLKFNKGIIHTDGDAYYIHLNNTGGGGSGEMYYFADGAFFMKITAEKAVDYGPIKAVHIIRHNEYFYYMEMFDRILNTPGTGKIMRMDMDGSNKKTIVSDPVYGPFHIAGDRLYFTDLNDRNSYSVDLEGEDRTPVNDFIAPDGNRIWLDFYDDIIISKYWSQSGYSRGTFTFPNEYAGPAIMDLSGGNLQTFPAELCGENAYEVVNWGCKVMFYDDEYHYSNNDFLFLKSTSDGSYWVYSKRHYTDNELSYLKKQHGVSGN